MARSLEQLDVLVRQLQGAVRPTRCTMATLPGNPYVGQIVFVSDAAAGSKFQGWDGAAWVSLG